MLDIEMGVFHLRAFAVVISERPLVHSRIGEAPALQICHNLTVTVGLLLRCLPVNAFLLTLAGTGEQPSLQRRLVHAKLLGSAALPAVQKPIRPGVVSWLQLGHGHSLHNAVKIIHRLSPSS